MSGNILSFLLPLFQEESCQLLAKVCARSTGYHLGGLSLPRKSVVRLTDRPDMTLEVYRGRKTTIQQQQQQTLITKTHYNEGPLYMLYILVQSVAINVSSNFEFPSTYMYFHVYFLIFCR